MFSKKMTAVRLLICASFILLLQGCAGSFDQAEYLKALLDAAYKADFSEYTVLTGCTEEEAQEQYEHGIETVTGDLCASLGTDIPPEIRERLSVSVENVFTAASYEVLSAVKVDGKQYDVLLKVSPILNFSNLEDELKTFAEEFLESIYSPGLQDESPEYVYGLFLDGLTDIIEKGTETIEYGDTHELTVSVMYDKKEKAWYVPDKQQDEIFDMIIGM